MQPRSHRGSQKETVFREVDNTPSKFRGKLCPSNLQEEKERFLRSGQTPRFNLKESSTDLDKATRKSRGQIRFDLLKEAQAILDIVKKKYGDGDCYMGVAYGRQIDQTEATKALMVYLNDNNINGEITIYWTPDLTASAKMMWHGPNVRVSKPEARKYTLIIKNSSDNQMLRERGINCLADHEIGTHFFRMLNDGLQPWFSDRKKFGLREVKTREHVASEEGLASVNTLVNAKAKYLFRPALLYYTACMSASMGFKEVYDHLALYVADIDTRWRLVMRVKRGLSDPGKNGGYGNDQCYFEGAVEILQNIDEIDFNVLYSGKVCVDEVARVHRMARQDCIRLPTFLQNIEKYRKKLRHIALINQIPAKPPDEVHTSPIGTDSPLYRLLRLSTPNTSRSSNMTMANTSRSGNVTMTNASRSSNVAMTNASRSSNAKDSASRRKLSKSKLPPSPSRDRLRKKTTTHKLSRRSSHINTSPDTAKKPDSSCPKRASTAGNANILRDLDLDLRSIEDLESVDLIRCFKDVRLLQRPQSSTNKLR